LLEFVEVRDDVAGDGRTGSVTPVPPVGSGTPDATVRDAAEPRWSLWGDAEA
jgi:hypothetical protein